MKHLQKSILSLFLVLALLAGFWVFPTSANSALVNLFDTAQMTNGWVNATGSSPDGAFKTSHYIEVSPGDVITFGAAVTSQGWHFAIYDSSKNAVGDGRLSTGVTKADTIDDATSIMSYTVPDGTAFIRMVADAKYTNKYLVTKNQAFTVDQYNAFFNISSDSSFVNLYDETDAFAGYITGTGVQSANTVFITLAPITVEEGDVITFGAAVTSQGWHLITLNSTDAITGQVTPGGLTKITTLDDATSIFSYTVPAGVSAIRMVVDTKYKDAYLITKNQTFTAEDYQTFFSEGEPEVKPDETSPLYGKTALFVGDSICYGQWDNEPRQGWAGRIGEAYGMTVTNAGIGGTTISNIRSGRIVNQIYNNKGNSYDYVILQGGTNDGWGDMASTGTTPAPVGSMTDSFEVKDFDVTTFAGGLEELFYYTFRYFPNAKIGFMTTFATPLGATQNLGATGDMSEYYDLAVEICEKWGVQCLDLYNDRYVSNTLMQVTTYNCLRDPLHPNAKGYDNLAPYIGDWMERMVDNDTYKENPFVNKRALFVGDSISYGHADTPQGYSWAGRIADDLGILSDNQSTSGWSVSTIRGSQIVQMLEKNKEKNYDYVIMHGGTNDGWDNAPVGEITNGYNSANFNRSTFAGALEHMFYTAYKEFPEARLGYIITFAMPRAAQLSTPGNLTNMEPYYSVAIKICRKWQVSYLDLYHDDYVNNTLLEVNTAKYVPDSVHPNKAGYDRLSPYIQEWFKTVPYADTDILQNQKAYTDALATDALIDTIGQVTADNYTEKRTVIENAEKAVKTLTDTYGDSVVTMLGSYDVLTKAKAAYEQLVAEANLDALVQQTVQTIEAIGQVTADNYTQKLIAIEAAEQAVADLVAAAGEDIRERITNLTLLTAARENYDNFSAISQFTPGDVNGDGRIDAVDALWVLQAAVDKRNLDEIQTLSADMNADRKLDATDALKILQLAVGK